MAKAEGSVAVVADAHVLSNRSSFHYLQKALIDAGFNPLDCSYFPGTEPDVFEHTPESLALHGQEYLLPCLLKHPRSIIIGFGNNSLCTLGLVKKPAGIKSHRGKLLTLDSLPCPVVMSISPSAVMREPHQEDGFRSDLAFACRCLQEGGVDVKNEAPMTIRDIETLDDLHELWLECSKKNFCAYDTETTGLDRDNDLVISAAFTTGAVEEDGSMRVWFWCSHDKLVPRYDPAHLEDMRKGFRKFFEAAGTEYHMIAHNSGFDDWICETWLIGPPEVRYDDPFMRLKAQTLPGVTYDTMYMKWAIDNERPHGLKDSIGKFLGYAEYDSEIRVRVKGIKDRRGKVLKDPEDFFVLDWFGHKPVVSSETKEKKNLKWPKEVDKGLAAYAMIEYPVLRHYNCLDAVYTFMLFEYFYDRITEENLEVSCDLRHIAHKRLIRAEQRGIWLDVKKNREYSARLGKIIDDCDKKIDDLLLQDEQFHPLVYAKPTKKGDPGGFNPGSGAQVIKVLYGEIGEVPIINRKPFFRKYDETTVEELAEAVEADVYGDYSLVKQQLKEGTFSREAAMDRMQEIWAEATEDPYTILNFVPKLLGLAGLQYDPPAVTKKGAPSTSRPSLITLLKQKPNDLLDLILMRNKAVKMKTSFIDKIYNCRDRWDLVRTTTNPHGTQSGRLSSSGNFNIQNLPKFLRGMFISRPGMNFCGLDYKSAEVFTLAAYADDPALMQAIYSSDTHRFVASYIYDKVDCPETVTKAERSAGKNSVFLVVYGGGADKLALMLGITKSKAQWIIDMLLAKFPGISVFMNKAIAAASVMPYYTYTAFGTRRSTKDILSNDAKIRSHVQRFAANHAIQGSAGEMCIYKIDLACQRTMDVGWDVWFINTVHDSKLFETFEENAWREPVIDPDTNEQVKTDEGDLVWVYKGPLVELLQDVVAETVPFPPLDKVTYRCDLEVDKFWDGEPSLDKALSDKNKGGFRFDLLPKVSMSVFDLQNVDKDEDGEEIDEESVEIAVLKG